MVREALIAAYSALAIVVLGTILNLLTLTILCRSTFRNKRPRAALRYMRTIACFDILMLYGWNFDHYLDGAHGFTLQTTSISLCRILSFYNYFTSQSSAWLRTFVCLDRYLSLSHFQNTWFHRSKNSLIIILWIMIFLTLLNSIFFFYGCSYKADGTIRVQPSIFQLYPLWDYINLGVYNLLPFILMMSFNSGVIYHLLSYRHEVINQNSRIRHRSISLTLVITTCLFLTMTVPATIGYAFFSSSNSTILHLLDGMLYTYHLTSFPLYMITFGKFRREFLAFITCRHTNTRIVPIRR